MGKLKGNKSNVKNNIFKLAGCQSLKTKNKAKAVTADRLKQQNLKNKQKIENIDKQLINLNANIRQPVKRNDFVENKKTATVTDRLEKIIKYNEAEKSCKQALEKLCSMEM